MELLEGTFAIRNSFLFPSSIFIHLELYPRQNLCNFKLSALPYPPQNISA